MAGSPFVANHPTGTEEALGHIECKSRFERVVRQKYLISFKNENKKARVRPPLFGGGLNRLLNANCYVILGTYIDIYRYLYVYVYF